MSLVQKQHDFLLMVCKLIKFAADLGYQISGGELWRTEEMARIYVAQKKGIANSKHCSRLAIDLNFFRGGVLVKGKVDLEAIGLYWESLGGTWGGRFTAYDDSGHFQYK